jgi:hypothetical protein
VTAAGWIVLLVLAVCAALLVLAVRWFRTSDEEDARRGVELARRLGARPGRDAQGRDILELELEWRKFRLTRLWRKRGASTWVETPVEAPGFGFELQPRRALVVATIGDTLARQGEASVGERLAG